jgi:hypothetical protein
MGESMKLALAGLLAVAVMFAACSSSGSPAPTQASRPDATTSNSPAGASVASNTVWLCKPGIANNPCEGDLTATVVHADGSTSIEKAQSAKNAPIDCFYVYPTASRQPTANADFSIDPAETNVAKLQVARFSQQCRVYAPIYRQLTVDGLFGQNLPEGSAKADPEEAYQDVVSAWKDYLAHDNDGRGFVLIGHSQGSFELTRLIREQIDNNASVRARLVSAIVLGGNVTVLNDAAGAGAIATAAASGGASFAHIPACTSASQLGCVVAYSSFPSMPPANAIFGLVRGTAASTSHVLCTDPAALAGGTGASTSTCPRRPARSPGSAIFRR